MATHMHTACTHTKSFLPIQDLAPWLAASCMSNHVAWTPQDFNIISTESLGVLKLKETRPQPYRQPNGAYLIDLPVI